MNEKKLQKQVSELVQKLRIVLKNEKNCMFSNNPFLATFFIYVRKGFLSKSSNQIAFEQLRQLDPELIETAPHSRKVSAPKQLKQQTDAIFLALLS